jgi:hypothetical protein
MSSADGSSLGSRLLGGNADTLTLLHCSFKGLDRFGLTDKQWDPAERPRRGSKRVAESFAQLVPGFMAYLMRKRVDDIGNRATLPQRPLQKIFLQVKNDGRFLRSSC